MKNWKIWIFFLLFLFILLVGFVYIREKYPKEVVKIEIRENEKKIDSLKSIIEKNSLVIDSLKKKRNKIIEKVIVKIKEVKTLSPDSTISLFHENLQTYGDIRSELPVLKEDSSVICSLDNLRGANIISAKLEGNNVECETLKEIVCLDSGIIDKKDSIILENSIILEKTRDEYDKGLSNLTKQLKKESAKRKAATYGFTISLIGILGALVLMR